MDPQDWKNPTKRERRANELFEQAQLLLINKRQKRKKVRFIALTETLNDENKTYEQKN